MDCCCCIGKMDQFPLFNLNFDQTSSNSKIVRQCFSTFQKKIQYLQQQKNWSINKEEAKNLGYIQKERRKKEERNILTYN